MNKTVILPIISFVALGVQTLFHIGINADIQGQIADAILLGVTLYGIIKNHKKE